MRRPREPAAFAPRGDHIVFGFVDTAATPSSRALGSLGDLPTFIQEQAVETVVICGHLSDEALHDVVEQSITAGCHVFSCRGRSRSPAYNRALCGSAASRLWS